MTDATAAVGGEARRFDVRHAIARLAPGNLVAALEAEQER